MMKFLTTTTLLALWMGSSCTVEAHQDVLNVHGSGTTNPSKCFWAIMEDFTDQTLHPIRMSYRAVGSSTGIAEFVNNFTATPSSDFGSGDLPLPEETYQGLFDAGVTVIHLPILLGAVSFFHSVPDVDKVDLDACLLARIFQRDLTNWGHEDIVALNPELKGVDLDITVARRVRGSSSTDSITRVRRDSGSFGLPTRTTCLVVTGPLPSPSILTHPPTLRLPTLLRPKTLLPTPVLV
jgi:ABC-type phosphate transport system substrate-binding protein